MINSEVIAQPVIKPTEPNRLPQLPESLLKPEIPNLLPLPESPSRVPSQPQPIDTKEPQIKVTVRQIRVLGSTIFSEAELQEAVAIYLDKAATIQDLLAIRSTITDLYTTRGYLTSGAFLPAQLQDFDKGIISIQIIEGELERIDIKGLSRLQEGYVQSRLSQAGKRPVNIRNLESGLQLLQLDSLFNSVQAELKAGTSVGRSILEVTLQENPSWIASATIESRESPTVGEIGLYGSIGDRNFTGLGDNLSLDLGGTEGTRRYGIQYNLPLDWHNELQFRYNYNTSRIITPKFAAIDINSRTQSSTLGYRYFLLRQPTSEISLGINFESRESRDFLLGNVPFSFSLGADNGRSAVNVLRFSQEWIDRSINRVLAARSQLSLGLGILGATVNDRGVDGRFLSWQGQFQWIQSLGKNTISIVRLGTQLTDKALLPIEKFGIGGLDSIRGYQQNLYVGDSGVVGTVEFRLPVWSNPAIGLLQITPFIDVGQVWSNSPNNFSGLLASAGLGLRWELGSSIRAKLEWAVQLNSINNSINSEPAQSLLFSLQISNF
ncbi:ShlB/FhaC/HecB family hemolysin secretion/activation protein [Pseudanabaena biceps]|nr:ShlB/FhaC/HecB family hemolysin secretion/activation protein [Pseudanabaena biceps]